MAANVYVRTGGAGNGSDWDNALSQLPSPLVRGNTYYMADGTYNGGTINVTRSATTLITIKKASAAEHGTDIGWDNSYGDGQAVFGSFSISGDTGYITFDGSYKYGFRWNVPSGPGVPGGTCAFSVRNDTGTIPNLSWKYCEILGPALGKVNYPYAVDDCPRGIRGWEGFGTAYDNYLISHCSIQGLIDPIFLYRANYLTIEYCELAWSSSGTAGNHGDLVYLKISDGGVFRYNVMHDLNAEGVLLSGSGNNWQVYGNLCYKGDAGHSGYPRFFELYGGGTYSGHLYYNNTLVDLPLGLQLRSDAYSSAHSVRNNIFYNSGTLFYGATNDYNWYSGSSAHGEPHGIAGGSSMPFTNKTGNDYHITATVSSTLPRQKGVALEPQFSQDMDASVRGSDGFWDIGAYEYGGGASTNPVVATSATALDFGLIPVGGSSNQSFTIRNVGGGLLSGTASVPDPFAIVSGGAYTNLGTGQIHTVIVSYRPLDSGDYSANIGLTGADETLVPVQGSAYNMLSELTFRADQGTISPPFASTNGTVFQTVQSGASDGGRAIYAFNVTNSVTTSFLVQAFAEAPSTAENSFYVNIDAEPTDPQMVWHVPVGSGFTTSLVSWQGYGTYDLPQFSPKVFRLSPGPHQLIIRGREPNTKLQLISLVKVPNPPPNFRVAFGH